MNMREVLEAMRLNGLHDEAAAVGIVMQQRAELLEALQKLHSVALGSVELDDWRELQDALDCAAKAINRAEAAE